MSCYFPMTLPQTANRSEPLVVPCGRCIGCRLERSRQWAIRCVHEAQMHDENAFITLTYKDEELIYGAQDFGILYPRHLELFWKRLRKCTRKRIRYFACGEYGEQYHRPHYHACIFGYDFPDKTLENTKDSGNYYHSDMLDDIWSHGRCIIGDVSFESAAYVARYVMKKRLGATAISYKKEGIEPEFVRMSRRPGIGASWYEKYKTDVFPSDGVVIRGGVKCKPPKFYSERFKKEFPLVFDDISLARFDLSRKRWQDNTPLRLGVRYRIKLASISLLKRTLSSYSF